MTENIANQKSNNAIKRKSIGRAQNNNRQTHCQETLISLKTFFIKSRDTIKEDSPVKDTGPCQIMRKINGKVADNSI